MSSKQKKKLIIFSVIFDLILCIIGFILEKYVNALFGIIIIIGFIIAIFSPSIIIKCIKTNYTKELEDIKRTKVQDFIYRFLKGEYEHFLPLEEYDHKNELYLYYSYTFFKITYTPKNISKKEPLEIVITKQDFKITYQNNKTKREHSKYSSLDEVYEAIKAICKRFIGVKDMTTKKHINDINKALEIATKAHQGQFDKVGNEYINHPIIVSGYCTTNESKIVALLHATVEDTDVTLDYLKQFFTPNIINAIDLVTKKEGYDIKEYYQNIKKNKIAREVKLADLRHNMDLSRYNGHKITDVEINKTKKYQIYYNYLLNDEEELNI